MFKVELIESGFIMADGGAMFGAIPKRAWSRKYPSDDSNLCKLAMRCLLATSKDRRILIDTGMGYKHIEQASYYQPHSLVNIEDKINNLGHRVEEITDVVLTHLHFDHCGHATKKDVDGIIKPTFPNARYWLSQKQWDNLQSPSILEKDSIFEENILPIHEAGLLHIINDESIICKGFNLKLFDGHSEGQIVSYIETENDEIYCFPGDLIPTTAHVPITWISAYDICALTSANEKQKFLEEAERKNYTLVYCHDSVHQKSKVKKLNDGFKAIL